MITENKLSKRPVCDSVNWESNHEEREELRQKYVEYLSKNPENFVVIDFETMSKSPLSACSIGMIRMGDGTIGETFHKLISPVKLPGVYEEEFRYLHGIRLKDCLKYGKRFNELYDEIMDFIGDRMIVCHNKSFDITVFRELCIYYEIDDKRWQNVTDSRNVICTYALTGCTLDLATYILGIELKKHHNALADCYACAEIFQKMMTEEFPISDELLSKLKKIARHYRNKSEELDKIIMLQEKQKELKNKDLATWLAVLLGSFGTHDFYLGHHTKGFLKLAFCWTGIPLVLGVFDGMKYIHTSNTRFQFDYVK